MAAKGTTYAQGLLQLVFNATNIANIADNASSSPLTNLYVSLHNASPGAGGNQTTNETAYTGYARVAVSRTSGGWTITSNSVSPTSTIIFGACTAGTDTLTYYSIGTASTGTGEILYFGSISPTIAVASGVTPELLSSSTLSET
jgi:hypothetical protein